MVHRTAISTTTTATMVTVVIITAKCNLRITKLFQTISWNRLAVTITVTAVATIIIITTATAIRRFMDRVVPLTRTHPVRYRSAIRAALSSSKPSLYTIHRHRRRSSRSRTVKTSLPTFCHRLARRATILRTTVSHKEVISRHRKRVSNNSSAPQ